MEKSYTMMILAITLAAGSALLPDDAFRRPVPPVSLDEARSVPESRDSSSAFLAASAELSHGWYSARGMTPITLRLRLRAPRNTDGIRPPADIVVVLDRSGSMEGEDRIGFARKALIETGRGLRDGDRLGVVSFSDHAWNQHELAPVDEREYNLRQIAANITPEGGTNLEGGLNAALGMLRQSPKGRMRQILLLSDGHANIGRRGPDLAALGGELGQEGVMITALGVGHDFDVGTFITLSEASGGGYAHVTRAERIPDGVRGELSRAGNRVLENLRVRLDLAPGVTVIRAVKHTIRPSGRSVEILAPTLAAGEERTILVDLVVDGPKLPAEWKDGAQRLVDVNLRYERPNGAETTSEAIALHLGGKPTENARLVELSADPDIVAERETLGADLAWADSARHVASGNYDLATAQLREEARILREKNEQLNSPSVANRIADLLAAATRIESRDFWGGSAASEATMGQNQAALSAGVY
jgi:Ca-activated chloride channel family protein